MGIRKDVDKLGEKVDQQGNGRLRGGLGKSAHKRLDEHVGTGHG